MGREILIYDIEKIENLLNSGYSYRAIAKKIGCKNHQSLTQWLKRNCTIRKEIKYKITLNT